MEVPAAVLNETGVLGIRASAAPGPFWQKQPSQQPFVGIIDCGASFTTVNTQVRALEGLHLAGSAYQASFAGRHGCNSEHSEPQVVGMLLP